MGVLPAREITGVGGPQKPPTVPNGNIFADRLDTGGHKGLPKRNEQQWSKQAVPKRVVFNESAGECATKRDEPRHKNQPTAGSHARIVIEPERN